MAESALQRDCHLFMEKRGAYAINQWGTALSGSGVPDNIYCYRGYFLALEFKVVSGKPREGATVLNDLLATKAQQMHLRNIRKAGGIAFVVTSLVSLENLLHTIDTEIIDGRR